MNILNKTSEMGVCCFVCFYIDTILVVSLILIYHDNTYNLYCGDVALGQGNTDGDMTR